MWSFLRLRFSSTRLPTRPEEQALECLQDVYRFAYFLVGTRLAAEELVEVAYQKVWRQYSGGNRIDNWRLELLRTLMEVTEAPRFSNIAAGHEDPPPLWMALSNLDVNARTVLLLDALQVPLKQVAQIVNASETVASQRLQAARNDFRNYWPHEG